MTNSAMTRRIFNFSPGPATLPQSVLEKAQQELLSYNGLGMSVMEISHRSKDFIAIQDAAADNLRQLLGLSDEFEILFLQGGSRLQFSMIPMNLSAADSKAHYFVTGTWSKKSVEEARRCPSIDVDVVCDFASSKYDQLPTPGSYSIDSNAAYAYFCSNETVQGVQFSSEPDVGNVPLICDASSDFLCRPLPMEKYSLVYACAQKNLGPAGVTIVVMRKNLLTRASDQIPGYLNYRTHAENASMFNTPPTFAIYIVKLVTDWLINDVGGLEKMHARNQAKAEMLYDVIDQSDGFYIPHAQSDSRSIMNVTFQLPNDELLSDFLNSAKEHNLVNLKGHRSVGGIRASIYNAMPTEGVTALRDFMKSYCEDHR